MNCSAMSSGDGADSGCGDLFDHTVCRKEWNCVAVFVPLCSCEEKEAFADEGD
jgi:hypothetical protein